MAPEPSNGRHDHLHDERSIHFQGAEAKEEFRVSEGTLPVTINRSKASTKRDEARYFTKGKEAGLDKATIDDRVEVVRSAGGCVRFEERRKDQFIVADCFSNLRG
jgi:hypothetical protein